MKLTATPYGTDTQDLNSLLCLLPFKPNTQAGLPPERWSVKKPGEIASLSVVSVLGIYYLLRMAAERGDRESDGRIFIAKADGTHSYFPEQVILTNYGFSPPLEKEMQAAFTERTFNAKPITHPIYNDDSATYEPKAADIGQNMALRAWLSSPASLRIFLQLCHDAPEAAVQASEQMAMAELLTDDTVGASGDEEGTEEIADPSSAGKIRFIAKQAKRRSVVSPMLELLSNLQAFPDDKVARLIAIIEAHVEHHKAELHEKVVIFVNRYATAVYLEAKLKHRFLMLRVACTARQSGKEYVLDNPETRRVKVCEFSPLANNTPDLTYGDKYDVLICTDADGVGVNMEDAQVVVNYDLLRGADELFQRFGRVFRMTENPNRRVHPFNFLPTLSASDTVAGRKARDLTRKLTKRHDTSSEIVGGSLIHHEDGVPLFDTLVVPLSQESDLNQLTKFLSTPEDFLSKEVNPFF